MEKQRLRKVDFLFSLALIAFGIVVVVAASRMPWTSTQTGISAAWHLSPGLFPALLGALLIVFSLSVLATAVAAGGHRDIVTFVRGALARIPRNRSLHRVLLIIVLIGGYVFGLVGHVNYYVASSIYLFMFMLLFHKAPRGRSTTRNALMLLAIAIAVPLAIGYLFSTYLNVPLP
ncbi:MAG: tripartite tricarboxylate transporter TctB family protein [Betaproteobacteria bacterium]